MQEHRAAASLGPPRPSNTGGSAVQLAGANLVGLPPLLASEALALARSTRMGCVTWAQAAA
jgi:hypothetical protein